MEFDRCGLDRSAVSHAIARKEEKKQPQTIIDEAKKRANIPPLIVPGTPPDEEVKRQTIIKITRALTSNSSKLIRHLHDIHQDQLRAMGMTGTLEMIRANLLEAMHAVDERRVAEETIPPGPRPDEEARRRTIIKAMHSLRDSAIELSQLLQDVQGDPPGARGITGTLKSTRGILEGVTSTVDDLLQRQLPEQQETPGIPQ